MIEIESPNEILNLERALTEAGFDHASVESPAFGDRAQTFSRGGLRVRAMRDRDQWWIEVAGTETDFYDPDIWRAFLEGRAAPLEPRPLADQAAYVLGHLDELTTAAAQAETVDRLRDRGLERTTGRLGRTDR